MLELGSFLQDTPIWGALIASLVAQVFKVGLVLVTERRWAFDRLLDTGGMPSSLSLIHI